MTTFADRQAAAWSRPPVDDVGYIPSGQLMAMSDTALRGVIDAMRHARYTGWRNHGGLWRDLLGLDRDGTGRAVIDYGCGTGMESAELAATGYTVTCADIVPENVELARRVCALYGYQAAGIVLSQEPPFIPPGFDESFDVFHCSGVLHHIPEPVPVMERAWQVLKSHGEARLMLYSAEGWRKYVGTEPPDDVTADPLFERFIRVFDEVGEHADWYDAARIQARFGQWFTLIRYQLITGDRRYLAAVLSRRPWVRG